ncbi:hypothetical protein [Daejeonella sp.]|uniref:hypothetical protein n=1 Tax=Daejeonella sp. TaxID=2805397 RepID=UPI0025BD9A54|nr:hypothetical protein [Daejeonella sp.]
MEIKIFKKAIVLSLTLLFSEMALAQTTQIVYLNDSKIRVDLNNIEFDVAKALKTVRLELKSLNFRRIGAAFDAIGKDIDREFSDVDFEIIDVNPGVEPKYGNTAEKTKRVVKSYQVDKDDKLVINNQYGKVAVHVWNKNEIKVEVEIKAFESSENRANQLLDHVNISETQVNNLISFKTNFGKISENFRSYINKGGGDARRIQVNYVIYMPAKNALDIDNKYGGIEIDDFAGPLNINSVYGSFSAGKIDHPENQVKVTYGSASIDNFSNGDLLVTYGSLKLNEADKLNATIKYSSAKIAHLSNGGTFSLAYSGGFKIDTVDKNVKNLNINSAYSGLTLGFDEAADFDLDVTVSYAGFNYIANQITIMDQALNNPKSKAWNPTKHFLGRIGKGSESKIVIKSSYGSVKFL